jgi:hypothetical protein
MRSRSVLVLALVAVAFLVAFAARSVRAFPAMARDSKAACAACHVNPAGGADLTEAGKARKADPKAAVPADVKGSEYAGINKCRMCHLKEYKAWADTKHAMAFAALGKGDAKAIADVAAKLKIQIKGSAAKTDSCVVCHVVGFKLAGGYPQADSLKNANVMNVGCEACHGPGSEHIKAPKETKKNFINAKVGAALCMNCHTKAMTPDFKFEEAVKVGVHQVAAAK